MQMNRLGECTADIGLNEKVTSCFGFNLAMQNLPIHFTYCRYRLQNNYYFTCVEVNSK